MSVDDRRKTLEAEGYLVRHYVWHAPNGDSLRVAGCERP